MSETKTKTSRKRRQRTGSSNPDDPGIPGSVSRIMSRILGLPASPRATTASGSDGEGTGSCNDGSGGRQIDCPILSDSASDSAQRNNLCYSWEKFQMTQWIVYSGSQSVEC